MTKLMIFQKIYGQIMKTRQQFKLFQRKIQKKNKIDCMKVKGVELSKKECELKSIFL